MNLKDFFESEKYRIIEPDAFFTKRVVARLQAVRVPRSGIWETLSASTKPVLAVALFMILCFLAIQLFIPEIPQRGIVESVFDDEQSPDESLIYNDTDVPARQVVLQQLIGGEDGR